MCGPGEPGLLGGHHSHLVTDASEKSHLASRLVVWVPGTERNGKIAAFWGVHRSLRGRMLTALTGISIPTQKEKTISRYPRG